MANIHFDAEAIKARYLTQRSTLLSLWVTRQGEEFVLDNDERLCDIELLAAHAVIVGTKGTLTADNYQDQRDSVFDYAQDANPNQVEPWTKGEDPFSYDMFTTHINLDIQGMTHTGHFMQDTSDPINYNRFIVPTYGALVSDLVNTNLSTPNKVILEACRLQPRIKVEAYYPGTSGKEGRKVRFLRDIVEQSQTALDKGLRGQVKIVNESGEFLFDPNVCCRILLQFRVTPRVTY